MPSVNPIDDQIDKLKQIIQTLEHQQAAFGWFSKQRPLSNYFTNQGTDDLENVLIMGQSPQKFYEQSIKEYVRPTTSFIKRWWIRLTKNAEQRKALWSLYEQRMALAVLEKTKLTSSLSSEETSVVITTHEQGVKPTSSDINLGQNEIAESNADAALVLKELTDCWEKTSELLKQLVETYRALPLGSTLAVDAKESYLRQEQEISKEIKRICRTAALKLHPDKQVANFSRETRDETRSEIRAKATELFQELQATLEGINQLFSVRNDELYRAEEQRQQAEMEQKFREELNKLHKKLDKLKERLAENSKCLDKLNECLDEQAQQLNEDSKRLYKLNEHLDQQTQQLNENSKCLYKLNEHLDQQTQQLEELKRQARENRELIHRLLEMQESNQQPTQPQSSNASMNDQRNTRVSFKGR